MRWNSASSHSVFLNFPLNLIQKPIWKKLLCLVPKHSFLALCCHLVAWYSIISLHCNCSAPTVWTGTFALCIVVTVCHNKHTSTCSFTSKKFVTGVASCKCNTIEKIYKCRALTSTMQNLFFSFFTLLTCMYEPNAGTQSPGQSHSDVNKMTVKERKNSLSMSCWVLRLKTISAKVVSVTVVADNITSLVFRVCKSNRCVVVFRALWDTCHSAFCCSSYLEQHFTLSLYFYLDFVAVISPTWSCVFSFYNSH